MYSALWCVHWAGTHSLSLLLMLFSHYPSLSPHPSVSPPPDMDLTLKMAWLCHHFGLWPGSHDPFDVSFAVFMLFKRCAVRLWDLVHFGLSCHLCWAQANDWSRRRGEGVLDWLTGLGTGMDDQIIMAFLYLCLVPLSFVLNYILFWICSFPWLWGEAISGRRLVFPSL